MGFSTDHKLVIAVSSRALFNLENENQIFYTQGEEEYIEYQWQHKDELLDKGVAFPFVKRLLQFNALKKDGIVEVILLSKNSPISGLRAFKSCEKYGLGITRGVFTAGNDPYPYMKAFNCCLFLSADKDDVKHAIRQSLPAGCVLPTNAPDDPKTGELRIAFDFDGVIADDSSERIYQEKGIEEYQREEKTNADTPMLPGPLRELIDKLSKIQHWERRIKKKNPSYQPKLRIAIVTARNAPAHERVITTLKNWGITTVEAFFLGGLEKRRILEIFKPHLFFDDQMQHLEPACENTPSVHIPFGIINNSEAK